ncbi:alpha/beta hydrolase [Changchengzhania lutea]|uniref:alpha/beta hydrolase n=1 Tax=Changchengzhania lutea TaxID=2049305 RepID=UPI00163DD596|nr:alpha/beta hydrolase-fold protein [Changchengzhania lutea]
MKKTLSIPIILFISYFNAISHAQQVNQGNIIMGTVDSIQSKTLNELRKIWVHVPNAGNNTTEKYPVVYLLDGYAHFASVTGMIQQLSSINGNTIVPKMIVVGIPNTNRMRDLTPVAEINAGDKTDESHSGGGEQFMDFLETELIPYIEEKYPTAPYKMYIGHSLGGLTVINTLLKRPELFSSYLAIDPSLWWADSFTLNESKIILNEKDFLEKSLFVGIANTMDPKMDLNSVKKDTTQTTQHIRDILEFSKNVVPNSPHQNPINSFG